MLVVVVLELSLSLRLLVELVVVELVAYQQFFHLLQQQELQILVVVVEAV
jgi:hypothetical protein